MLRTNGASYQALAVATELDGNDLPAPLPLLVPAHIPVGRSPELAALVAARDDRAPDYDSDIAVDFHINAKGIDVYKREVGILHQREARRLIADSAEGVRDGEIIGQDTVQRGHITMYMSVQ